MGAIFLGCGAGGPQLKRNPLGSVIMRHILPFVPLLLVPPLAMAQDSVALDPAIAHVVTGGHWTQGGARGLYRIIVRTGGFEHVASELFIQWLDDPTQSDDPVKVRMTQPVDSIPARIWSLGRPTLNCSRACQVEIDGTNAYTNERAVWRITLGAPGQYQIRRK